VHSVEQIETENERSLSPLARRTLVTTTGLALAGSLLGTVAAFEGAGVGTELAIVLSCVVFSSSLLFALLAFRNASAQTIAIVSTVYYALYLCAGAVEAIASSGHPLHFFAYLVWFFPLLVYNKLVNAPTVGRLLGRILIVAPLLIVACLFARMLAVFTGAQFSLLGAFTLCFLAYAAAFDTIMRYREEYVAGRERKESRKAQSELLESISDCFISLDPEFRLTYANEAARAELGAKRRAPLDETLAAAAPGFLSEPMLAGLQDAYGKATASTFEAKAEHPERWYELRCFPRSDGMSVYFRNIGEAIQARRKLEEAQARTEHLAFYDVLTELPNRALLRNRLDQALAASLSHSTSGALLLIDLDQFKTANGTLGQEIGDLLLKEVALRLEACARTVDTVARLSGDEFAMLLEGLETDPSAAGARAEAACAAIRAAFIAPYHVGSFEYNASVCIGVALFAGGSESAGDVLKRADLALHRAKAEGRDRVRFFDPEMQKLVDARAALEFDLRRALHSDQFELHYQPQVDARGVVIGAEALLRWAHHSRGMVPPNEFIPLAEEGGLIVELGRWVLETACSQLAKWAVQPGMERLNLAVNVSLLQFLDSNFVHLVLDVLRESGADPRRLKLEITESSVMGDAADTIAKMTALRAHGVGFSIDDFGTGYSSLSHVRRLPLDELKVDRSFVNDVLTDDRDASIVRTIVALGRNLNLSVIAEGVETDGQRAFLEREGCLAYQGFLFSPALPRAKFEAFVAAAAVRRARAGAA